MVGKISYKMRSAVIALLLITISAAGYSQSLKEAQQLFNAGIQAKKEDPQTALQKFKECIEVSKAVGEEAQEVLSRAQSQLPVVYYYVGRDEYKAKNYDGMTNAFRKAIETGEKYNKTVVESKARQVLSQYFRNRGLQHYQQENLAMAKTYLDSAVYYYKESHKGHYYLAQVNLKQENEKQFRMHMAEAFALSEQNNDPKFRNKSQNVLRNFFLKKANDAMEEEAYQQTVNYADSALDYDSTASLAYYLKTQSHNSLKEYNQAIKAGNQALKYESGGDQAKAKIYYEIGNAYKALDNKSEACEAFRKAAYGDFKKRANYEIEEELDCE